MIEILVIIAVVRAFVKVAKDKKVNHITWGIIGALSYYVPVLVLGFLIFPALLKEGIWQPSSEGEAFGIALAVNLAAGIICCFIAYRILKSLPSKDPAVTADVIDNLK